MKVAGKEGGQHPSVEEQAYMKLMAFSKNSKSQPLPESTGSDVWLRSQSGLPKNEARETDRSLTL